MDCKKQNLLVNGNFSSLIESQKKFSNWKQIPKIKGWDLTAKSAEIWKSGFQGIQATSGDYLLELDAKRGDPADEIAQTVKTVPGNIYFLSFDLRQRRNTPEEVIVEWNDGKETHHLGNSKTTTKGKWEQQTFVFTATSDEAKITLREPGTDNDSFGVLLDNIKLIEDCSQQISTGDVTASIKVLNDNGREFSNGDKNQGIEGKVDYLSYVITLTGEAPADTLLQFTQVSTGTGKDANSEDVDIDNTQFFVDGSENINFQLKDKILSIPKGVKEFEARTPIIDDTIIEGTEQLNLKIGDGDDQNATAKIQDNDFVKLESFILNNKDAAEINQKAKYDPNKGTYEGYFLYTVELKSPLKQSQKLKFTQALNVDLAENDQAQKEDFILDNGRLQAEFEVTAFDSNIPGAKSSAPITNPNNGEIWVPVGVEAFTVKLPIFDDPHPEEKEQFTLEIAGQSQTGTIHDNDVATKPDDPVVTHIKTKNAKEGRKQDLKYEIILDKEAEEAFELSFTVPEDIEVKDIALGEQEGRAVFDYFRGKKAIGLTENVENNEDGTVTVPAGVKSFIANVPIVDDDIVEPTEVAILRVGDKEGIAQIFDNDEATAVESIIASDATEGDDERMEFTITLNRVAPQAKRFSYFLGGDAIGGTSELPHIDYLVGRNATGKTNITVSSSTTLDPENRTIRIKKGVQSFNLSIPIVDDLEVENPENILLQVGSTDGYGSIFDNDDETPISIAAIEASSVLEGDGKDLTYKVLFNKVAFEDEEFSFQLVGGENCFGAKVNKENEVDYLNGYSIIGTESITFNNGIRIKDNIVEEGRGTLIIPAGIQGFEVTVPVIDDTLVEDPETVSLKVGEEKEGTGQIFDNDTVIPDLQPVSINARSVQEGDERNLEYTITLNKVTTKKEELVFFIDEKSDAIGGESNDQETTDYLNGSNVKFQAVSQNGKSLSSESFELVSGDNNQRKLTIPEGISSFTASVEVIDDNRVEDTETAILKINDLKGIGEIFDNDSPEQIAKPVSINASSVQEGDGKDLVYKVLLNKRTLDSTNLSFSVDGDAIGAPVDTPNEVDYLNGSRNVTISNGVRNNGDGTVTIPADTQGFSVSVPVIDDTLVENTEEAILKIGNLKGIGQIFDNDSVENEKTPEVVSIAANGVLEGDGSDLKYIITFNEELSSETTLGFSVSGDAIGAENDTPNEVDYLIGKENVRFSKKVINNGDGTVTIPAGVKRLTATVSVIDDTLVEETETAILEIGNLEGVGQIFDNDSLEIITPPEVRSISGSAVIEGDGNNLIYTIKLSQETNAKTTFLYNVSNESTAVGAPVDRPNEVDYLTGPDNIEFSEDNVSTKQEKNNDSGGTVEIPAGISVFTVEVPVIDDTLVENTENAILEIGDARGTGIIFDNDSLSEEDYALQAVAINATSVKEGDKDQDGNQKSLEYTITLNQATTDKDRILKFSVSPPIDDTIAIGGLMDDKQTVDYLNSSNVAFSGFNDEGNTVDGTFELKEGDELTLPTGIRGFVASIPVIDDTRTENTETATLNIGDLQGIGQIFDNDSETKALKISATSVVEGDSNNPNLKYEVILNQATTQETLIPFSVTGDAIGGPIEVAGAGIDYLNGQNVTLSGGVTVINNTDGTKSVKIPAGVSSFTADVPVIDDDILEETETAILSIGELKGIGEIFDNDSQILIKNPEAISIGATSVLEGDGNLLTYTITFNTALFEDTELGFSVTGDATGGPNIAAGVDYLNGVNNVVFNNTGIKLSNGKVTIPKGVRSFTASVPVVDDAEVEPTETAILKIGNLEGIGQIFDNDTPIIGTNAQSIQATSVQEGDGRNLIYTVTLNQATTTNTDLAFLVSGDAIGAATNTPNQVDYLNGSNVILSGGVTNNGNGTVTIPTGVTSFTASVSVIDDTLVESTEEAIIKIGNLEGIGQIFDNDTNQNSGGGSGGGSQAVDLSVVAVYGDAVQEGDEKKLTYTVVLNRQTTESSNLSFSVSGDAIGAPIDTPNEVDYLTGSSNVTLSNGVKNNSNGSITIPAGVTSFTATVPVINDTLAEDTETAVLSIGNLQGTGQIFDNDTGAEPVSITASSVTEGDGQNLTYTVALGQATTQATDIAFSVSGDAIGAAADKPNEVDYLNGSSNVTLSDGVTNNGNGTVTVPKGVTSFTASVPVIDDTLPEDTETAVLNVGKLEGVGQIFDNDQTIDPIASDKVPQIKLIQTNAVLEGDGNDLIYKVKLDRKPKKKLQFAFNIGGDATFDLDYETGKKVTLTNGVKNKKPGSITIPAGVKSFKAKVPVIDDNLIEETETASIHFGRISGVGQIFDNDSLRINGNNPGSGGSSESEGPQTTNPGSGDVDVLSTKATLSLTSNGNGLEVKGDKSSSLWLELDVLYANDSMQNSLVIVNRNGDGLGTLGSTPKPLQNVGSSFRGSKHLLLNAGDEIYFRQASDNEPINEFPLFELERLDGKGFQLSLEDNRPDGGKDFNDLVVSIQPIQKPKDQELVEMAGIQRRTHDGLFDLSDLGKETTLTLTTLNNTGGDVLIGLVPVTGSQGAGFSVDGKDPRDGQRFEKAIRDNLIDPEQDSEETSGKTITASWSLDADDAGLYAPVLITEDDDVMTFGRRFGSTSDQRLKVLGDNVVGFELSAKDNRSDQEWHYDDVIVEAILG